MEHKKFCNFALMMKKITLMTGLLAAFCLLALATGCDQSRGSEKMDYTLTCTVDSPQPPDSATLLVLEDEYNRLRVCATAHAADRTFAFNGQTEGAKVALIRLDNDSIHPFLFILEPGHTDIHLKPNAWHISGGPQNTDYQWFVNKRNALMNQRVALWQEYLKADSVGTLNREEELRLVRQDSLLNDSVQRMTVKRINRGDAVGRIIRERYGSQLDREHARQLK